MTDTFNAAAYLTDHRVAAGDGARTALLFPPKRHHPRGTATYAELAEEVRRVAAGLVAIGVRPEERVLLSMVDDLELATGILATMYIGAVAVPSSTISRLSGQPRILPVRFSSRVWRHFAPQTSPDCSRRASTIFV